MPNCSRPPLIRVSGGSFLCHVQRVFVAHVDDAGADVDPGGAGGDG
jgi:hypothetical protein